MSHVLPNISRGRFFEPIFTSKKFDLYTSIYGMYVCVCMYVCMYVCVYVCTVCNYMYMYVYNYVHMCVHMDGWMDRCETF